MSDRKPPGERMLRWFEFKHLPPSLQEVSGPFQHMAVHLVTILDPGPERTVALRKLLESKDCAVRARIEMQDRQDLERRAKLDETAKAQGVEPVDEGGPFVEQD